ncbi:hypothetical protein VE02_01784 [Pseudogymnoascus sp. 03VT05]|nr:hypothetical protein VE02_01784 [Pseudogymnoascus sp. 03VT05]
MSDKGTSVQDDGSKDLSYESSQDAVAEIDLDAPSAQICSGFALISDGYQNNLMIMTNVLLRKKYPVYFTSPVSTRVSNALLIGEIFGQVTIGLTCDYLGRKFAIIVTTAMIVIGGILATASNGDSVLAACKYSHLGTVWRVCFGIGCVPPLTVFYFRLKMLNSKLYRRGAIKKRVPYSLVGSYYWKSLIGTCGAWFLYDFITFPNGVFSGTIIALVVSSSGDNVIMKTGQWQLLLGAIALPGVMVGAYLCDRLGRKNTMMLGFAGYVVFGLIIVCAYDKITKIVPLFVIFYGLMQSMGNLGPGDMLGLISSETYATSVRGTCYGLSAAVGKAGAAIGTQAFTPIQAHLGKKWAFIIAAICGVAGMLVTYYFIEDLSGEDLALRDERFRVYLVERGWEGEMGEDDLKGVAENVKVEEVVKSKEAAQS